MSVWSLRSLSGLSAFWAVLFGFIAMMPTGVAATGWAAPQAPGLVDTRDAMPLQCNGYHCIGFLSSFCLEEERMPLVVRCAYTPAPGTEITLIVETQDGCTVRLPGCDDMSFNVRLDFTSILAKLPQSKIAHLAPKRVSIHIAPLATLLPVPQPSDLDRHSPDELKLVLGPYRKTGTQFFDEGGETGETVSMMTQMINRLPRLARAPETARTGTLQTVLNGADGQASSAGARARFQGIVEEGEKMLETTKRMNMRACLTYRHEVMQTETNRAFWKALGGV